MSVELLRGAVILACVACGNATTGSNEKGVASATAAVTAAQVATSATSPTPSASAPASSASGSAPSSSVTASPADARAIATWLDETEKDRSRNGKSFTMEGVFLRSWLYQSGVYVGDEHPGIRYHVVNVADAPGAAPRDTLQCWTKLLTAPTDLNAGDRVRVEGNVSYLTGNAGRGFLPNLMDCKYTRL